jgi:hypothetical protein
MSRAVRVISYVATDPGADATHCPKSRASSFGRTESVFESDMRDLDPSQYGEADRRKIDPPIQVESATWSPGGTLDWWVKERQQWLGRVRGPDGRQKWIKATDLRPAKEGG